MFQLFAIKKTSVNFPRPGFPSKKYLCTTCSNLNSGYTYHTQSTRLIKHKHTHPHIHTTTTTTITYICIGNDRPILYYSGNYRNTQMTNINLPRRGIGAILVFIHCTLSTHLTPSPTTTYLSHI